MGHGRGGVRGGLLGRRQHGDVVEGARVDPVSFVAVEEHTGLVLEALHDGPLVPQTVRELCEDPGAIPHGHAGVSPRGRGGHNRGVERGGGSQAAHDLGHGEGGGQRGVVEGTSRKLVVLPGLGVGIGAVLLLHLGRRRVTVLDGEGADGGGFVGGGGGHVWSGEGDAARGEDEAVVDDLVAALPGREEDGVSSREGW